MYRWHKIQMLQKGGMKLKKIARTLGLPINTVRKYVRGQSPPEFQRSKCLSQLNPYVSQIQEMVEKKYIGTRIYRELLSLGYRGGIAQIRRYIRKWKQDSRKAARVTTRVETDPGQQAQYDWKEWMLPVKEQSVKIYLHQVILSYSRYKYYTFSLTLTRFDIMRAIQAAFLAFGGTPLELWIDNPKQMILTHRKNGVIGYQEDFLKFCGLYGIEPTACQPYRAQTKGKVERPFHTIQEQFLRGLKVSDLQEFEAGLFSFTLEENQRKNRDLGEAPLERFQRESPSLRPLPSLEPTSLFEREPRQITSDGYLHYGGNRYPVSMELALQEVWVESVFGRELKVYAKTGELMLTLPLVLSRQTQRPTHPEHEILNEAYREKRKQKQGAVVEKFKAAFGSVGEAYLEGLRQKVSGNLQWHLHEILKYEEVFGLEAVLHSIKACLTLGAYHKNSVQRLIQVHLKPQPLDPLKPLPLVHNLPAGSLIRELSDYASLTEVSHV